MQSGISFSVPDATKKLEFKSVMRLFTECGDTAPEFFFRMHPELDLNEQMLIYFLRAVYSGSKTTVRNYCRQLLKFLDFLFQNGIYSYGHATPEIVNNYCAKLRADELKASTINTYMQGLKSFYSKMLELGLFTGNMGQVFSARLNHEIQRAQRQSKGQLTGHVRKVITKEDLDNLLLLVKNKASVRDSTLLHFLYYTGARACEVEVLRWGDIYKTSEGWFAKLFGKGQKEREVFLPSMLMDELMVLRRTCFLVPQYVASPGLDHFPVFTVSAKNLKALSYMSIYKIIKHWGKEFGLNSSLSPHWLRHSHATHLREYGATLDQLQETMGHASINTTQIYDHSDKRKRAAGKIFEGRTSWES